MGIYPAAAQTLVGMMDDGSGCLMYSTEKQSCAVARMLVWIFVRGNGSLLNHNYLYFVCLYMCVCVCFCNSFTFIRDKYISLVLLHTNCIYTVQKIILAINVSSFYATFLSHDLIVTFIHRVGLEINMHLFSFLLA